MPTPSSSTVPATASTAAEKRPYQQCSIGLLDTIDDPDIRFDENGVCHYYQDYHKEAAKLLTGEARDRQLEETVASIKASGKGKKYDCVIGLSGGVDSTYLALIAKQQGLRPLAVHFDNGWNSEMAVSNIENIVNRLGFDLLTHVVNWEEFRDLQLAYLRSSVVDIEAITDHAIYATQFRLARENNVKHIISGTNIVTEAVLPRHWIYDKLDRVNIVAIHREFGKVPLKTFPFMDFNVKHFYTRLHGIRLTYLLNMVEYDKAEAKKAIIEELGWRDYGGKHYESVWTRFYQGYILPNKFGIDKRKAHLSNLIFSGQITKEEALEELKLPIYDPELLKQDMAFVLKKFGLTEEEFEEIMNIPVRQHSDFDTERSAYATYPWLRPLKPLGNLFKKIFRLS